MVENHKWLRTTVAEAKTVDCHILLSCQNDQTGFVVV